MKKVSFKLMMIMTILLALYAGVYDAEGLNYECSPQGSAKACQNLRQWYVDLKLGPFGMMLGLPIIILTRLLEREDRFK